jgi:hypothetical protein
MEANESAPTDANTTVASPAAQNNIAALDEVPSGDESDAEEQRDVLAKEDLLPLIINQLADFGYGNLAMAIQQHTETPGPIEPSSRLAELCYIALHGQGRYWDGDVNV